jgi:hypothetical protein
MSESDATVAEGSPTQTIEPLDAETARMENMVISGGSKKDKIRPFRKRSVEWLKKEAKNRGISGYSKKKKNELVEMLKGSKPASRSSIASERATLAA